MAKVDNKKDKKEKKALLKTSSLAIELDPTPDGISQKVSEIGLTVFSKKAAINMSLQFGEGATWETIRVIQTDSTYFLLLPSVVRPGGASNRFRLFFENESNEDIDLFYWVDTVLIRAF